jgi:uncharacterized membrane protein YtjA (UPF0391 family)
VRQRYGNAAVPEGNLWAKLAFSRTKGAFMPGNERKRAAMLGWAITFLVIALIAAVLGFGGIAGFAVEAAKLVFFVAIVLFLISAVVGLIRGRSPRVP